MFILFSSKNLSSNITILTTVSFIFLRLYPTITRMKVSYDSAMFNRYSALKTIKLLEEVTFIKQNENLINVDLKNSIRIHNITIKKSKKIIINDTNISFSKNDKILLKGETGSGKSTLIKFLTGNQSASFNLNNEKSLIYKNSYFKLKNISYIPQNPVLFNISIAKNISMELDENKIDYEKISRHFEELNLDKFKNLNENLSLDGSSVSGGERQRMSIARGLYNNPELIVMDEPFSSVDPETRDIIVNFLTKIAAEKTLIISSHNYENKKFYNRIIEIVNGKINEI